MRRRLLKLILRAVSLGMSLSIVCGLGLWLTLPDISALSSRKATLTLPVRDWKGKEHKFLLGPKNPRWTPLGKVPEALKWAVIVAEDANFFEHQGIDVPALKEALKYDLQHKRLARGASTITQQLAKNVYLSREKTLVRKAREILLAARIEQKLSKGRILELYLNVVELGPLVYGIGHGAQHHFNKPVSQLTPAECATLAAILPGPRVAYNPQLKPAKVRKRAARILRLLRGRRVLTDFDFALAMAELGGRPPEPEETALRDVEAQLEEPDVREEPESMPGGKDGR
jgi:monofunctional glycosyltransferase